MHLPGDVRYSAAFGILVGYVELILTNSTEVFSVEQLAEIRIVLDQLRKLVGEDNSIEEK